MQPVLLIPCKPFAQAKMRLSPALDPALRAALARALCRHTLGVAAASGLEGFVVSSDAEVLAMARSAGLQSLAEDHAQGLNAALDIATGRLAGRAASFAYLPTDLPRLSPADLAPLREAGAAAGLLIAPDAARQGTNLLCWPAASGLRPAFGEGSFGAHRRQAAERGLNVRVLDSAGLRHDIDLPQDLPGFGDASLSAPQIAERLIARLDAPLAA